VYNIERDGIRLYLQIDKRARGLFSMLAENWDLDERNISVFLSNAQITTPGEVAQRLANLIETEYRRII